MKAIEKILCLYFKISFERYKESKFSDFNQ